MWSSCQYWGRGRRRLQRTPARCGQRISGSERPGLIIPFDDSNAVRYYVWVIKSFADKPTAAVFQGIEVQSLPKQIQPTARRKLMLIETAPTVHSLRVPPGNRLEALKG